MPPTGASFRLRLPANGAVAKPARQALDVSRESSSSNLEALRCSTLQIRIPPSGNQERAKYDRHRNKPEMKAHPEVECRIRSGSAEVERLRSKFRGMKTIIDQ